MEIMCSLSPTADCDVLQGKLRYEGDDVRFSLTPIEFRWWREESSSEVKVKILVADMICVTSSYSSAPGGGTLQISYVEQRNWTDRTRTVALFHGQITVCRACAERLQRHISKGNGRPGSALVVISPVSGYCKGQQLYEDKVAPLFKEAGIQTDVKITERAGHAVKIAFQYDLTSIDSVVVVGGDGLYNEILNGLQRNPKYSRADDVMEPRALDIPIGIIPTGTGNEIAKRCYGGADIETAALSIIIGRRKRTGVFGVYSENKLVTYAGLSVTYGFYGDLMQIVASRRCRNRFMDIPMFVFTMLEFVLFTEIREIDVTVKYVQTATPKAANTRRKRHSTLTPTPPDASAPEMKDNTESHDSDTSAKESLNARVQECGKRSTELSGTDQPDHDSNRLSWSVTTGTYNEVMCMFPFDVFACQVNDGLRSGTVSRLLRYKPTSLFQFIRSLYHCIVKDYDSMSLDENVEHVLVSEYSVKLNKPSDSNTDNDKRELVLNVDGDVVNLHVPEFHVRLFDQKVELFCNQTD